MAHRTVGQKMAMTCWTETISRMGRWTTMKGRTGWMNLVKQCRTGLGAACLRSVRARKMGSRASTMGDLV